MAERNDGELSGITDYLASANYAKTLRQGIQKDTHESNTLNVRKMADVIAGLENINNFWEKRVVYGLRKEILAKVIMMQ